MKKEIEMGKISRRNVGESDVRGLMKWVDRVWFFFAGRFCGLMAVCELRFFVVADGTVCFVTNSNLYSTLIFR